MARWLVTGGAGFCGRAIVARLQQRGEIVRVLDTLPVTTPAVESFVGDVCDTVAVRRAMHDCQFVIHAAAAVPLARNRALFARVNVAGTATVLAIAREAGVTKTVVVSSSAVYGAPSQLPVTALTPMAPLEPYGQSKRDADLLALAQAAQGQAVAVVRPRTVLGPGRSGLFALLFEWVHRGHPIPLLGDGRAIYQFVHADDLADACIAAAQAPGPGPWLVGSAQPLPLGELLARFCVQAGTGSRVIALPASPVRPLLHLAAALPGGAIAPYHAQLYGKPLWFDIATTCQGLGWQPQFDDVTALTQSYQWYVSHRDDVAAGSAHSRPMAAGWLRWANRALRAAVRKCPCLLDK